MASNNSFLLLLPALLIIALLGYYGTWHRYAVSGGLEAITLAANNVVIPKLTMSHVPRPDKLITDFTGIAPFDNLLTMLILTFWPGLDGHNPSASLYNIHFAAQVTAPVMAMYVDSYRRGNRDSKWWLRSPTFWMTLAQLMANANSVAWFVGAYALTSVVWEGKRVGKLLLTMEEKAEEARDLNVVDDLTPLILLPVSMFLGHVVPCIAMGWRGTTEHTKQVWVMIWQFFPIWIGVSQLILRPVISICLNSDAIFSKYTTHQRRFLLVSRFVYGVTLFSTTFSHLFIVAFCFTSQYVPELFNPSVAQYLAPRQVLMLHFTLRKGDGPGDWAEAITDFLQWDQVVAFAGMLVWALILCLKAAGSRGWNVRWTTFAPAILLGYFVLGPGGVVLAIQWAKEEVLFQDVPGQVAVPVHVESDHKKRL